MISIIIPTYNKPDMLRDCLDSLLQHVSNAEIIVVDNGKDGLLNCLTRDITYIRFPDNRGFAHACNVGAKIATNDFLLFLNNDTLVHDDFVRPMLDAFDVGVGAVGSRLLYENGDIQHAGIEFIRDLEGNLQGANLRVERPAGYVSAVTGACMAVRKNAFWEASGFDEKYWNGNEDVDLCLKLRRNNWKIYYEPRSTVTHLESQSGPERWKRVHENVERLNRKWKQYILSPQ